MDRSFVRSLVESLGVAFDLTAGVTEGVLTVTNAPPKVTEDLRHDR